METKWKFNKGTQPGVTKSAKRIAREAAEAAAKDAVSQEQPGEAAVAPVAAAVEDVQPSASAEQPAQ